MKTTLRRTLKGLLCLAPVVLFLLARWCWQANYAERLLSIPVPHWIAGGGDVTYSIAIHSSQIKPYGTVWKQTVGVTDGIPWIMNFPIYDAQDVKNYYKRHPQERQPIETPPRKAKDPTSTVL